MQPFANLTSFRVFEEFHVDNGLQIQEPKSLPDGNTEIKILASHGSTITVRRNAEGDKSLMLLLVQSFQKMQGVKY